jgi:hypothetical protein
MQNVLRVTNGEKARGEREYGHGRVTCCETRVRLNAHNVNEDKES